MTLRMGLKIAFLFAWGALAVSSARRSKPDRWVEVRANFIAGCSPGLTAPACTCIADEFDRQGRWPDLQRWARNAPRIFEPWMLEALDHCRAIIPEGTWPPSVRDSARKRCLSLGPNEAYCGCIVAVLEQNVSWTEMMKNPGIFQRDEVAKEGAQCFAHLAGAKGEWPEDMVIRLVDGCAQQESRAVCQCRAGIFVELIRFDEYMKNIEDGSAVAEFRAKVDVVAAKQCSPSGERRPARRR